MSDKNIEEQPPIYQRSEGSNSPNIVGNNNTVIINPKAGQRRLSAVQSEAMLSVLKKSSGLKVIFETYDGESQAYSEDFVDALRRAGWPITGFSRTVLTSGTVPTDITLNVSSEPDAKSEGAAVFASALIAAGIDFGRTIHIWPNKKKMLAGQVYMTIGKQP